MCLPKSLTCITSDGEVEILKECDTCKRIMTKEEFVPDSNDCWSCEAAEYFDPKPGQEWLDYWKEIEELGRMGLLAPDGI